MSDPLFDQFAYDPTFDGPQAKATAQPEHKHEDFRGEFHDAATARQYIRAGKATITIRSKRTGTRFTYRCTLSDDESCVFVGVLAGPDNYASYKYLGRIAREIFWRGRKVPKPNDIARDAPSMIAFDWTWSKLLKDEMPKDLEIWHEGFCGRCGHKLTVPESIARGIGPDCWKRHYSNRDDDEQQMKLLEAQGDREQTIRDEKAKWEARSAMENRNNPLFAG